MKQATSGSLTRVGRGIGAVLCAGLVLAAPPVGAAADDAPGDGSFECVADSTTLCLNQGRFQVRVSWRDFDDQTGAGTVVSFGSDDSGLFWFFADDNWEMLVKVLDGCAINRRFWVFATATTDVEYTLEVIDSRNGKRNTYANPLGTASAAVTDTSAFEGCPPEP